LVGLIIGLVFGVIWIHDSFADAVLVGIVGLIGTYVGAIVSGEVNIVEVLARRGR